MRVLKKNPHKVKEIEQNPVRIKKKVLYLRKQCAYISDHGVRCKKLTRGRDNVCAVHGANVNVPETKSNTDVTFMKSLKYDPIRHPIEFIQLSFAGRSKPEIARHFRISIPVLNLWGEKYKEFATAMDIGSAAHEAWWISEGKTNLDSRFYNTSLYKYLTGNLLGYSEKIETTNTNKNTFGVLLIPPEQTIDDWEANNRNEVFDMEP